MKHTLNYGRTSWSYEDFDPKVHCRPSPIVFFYPIRINGKPKSPCFTDRTSLQLLKHKTANSSSFREAYINWFVERSWIDRDLGEGRSFLRWLQKENLSIKWKPSDFKIHDYFMQETSPKHKQDDEMARGLSFAIRPVEVKNRRVKLYLQDEAILNLLSLPYGEDQDFIQLVEQYVGLRFQWEEWKAPAPPFLEWVKAQAKRPIFKGGQLGFCL